MFLEVKPRGIPALVACLSLVPITAGCDDENGGPLFPGFSEELNAQLADLRSATEPFQQVEAAGAAGYNVLVAHPTNANICLRHSSLGAMGLHYLDQTLADDDVAVTEPEVLIYEPQANGSLELVGVEYLVPFAVRPDDATPPILFGREFKRNYTFGVWALHAWVWKDNPSGVFSDWNPDVSCQYVGQVD